MIEQRHHPWALEATVKDLWDLRLRSCTDDDTYRREEGIGPTFHSSQDGISLHDNGSLGTEANSWDADVGVDWRGPRVLDTLSVCYLGCLLLRLPTTVGDIVSWANSGDMPYKQAVSTHLHSAACMDVAANYPVVRDSPSGGALQASDALYYDLPETGTDGCETRQDSLEYI